ncbi:MAG: DNA double-strand break repair nuclease NurA, partial [Candidatus Hodarchaeota archaeon]
SRLIFHASFNDTIAEIRNLKIRLPSSPLGLEMDFDVFSFPPNGELVQKVEEIKKFKLNPYEGEKHCQSSSICAYDESVNKFQGLEGTAYLTSHSLILHGEQDFIPLNLLTFYFYTRSRSLTQNSKFVKYSEDHETDSKRDYVFDRKSLLVNNIPENSIAFIDGPLIGGQMSSYTVELNDLLLKKDVIPVFFVKNSTSNLVTNNVKELRGRYNSDMHWAYRYLKKGERTNLFKYMDQANSRFAKIFCYLKAFDVSPQRIEIDVKTYEKIIDRIPALFDLIYYLLLAQGDLKNPQIRSIAIAEKYARSTLSLINFVQMMKDLGIVPTMNQERFAW